MEAAADIRLHTRLECLGKFDQINKQRKVSRENKDISIFFTFKMITYTPYTLLVFDPINIRLTKYISCFLFKTQVDITLTSLFLYWITNSSALSWLLFRML